MVAMARCGHHGKVWEGRGVTIRGGRGFEWVRARMGVRGVSQRVVDAVGWVKGVCVGVNFRVLPNNRC